MGQLLVRGLDDRVVELLRERAARHGRSVEAEHRAILQSVLVEEPETFADLCARLRAEAPWPTTDSTELIRQDRDRDHRHPDEA